ncbi:MAG: T9SS type A sorting domain-containing protein, partial [Bacteroidales bacterium]|nr:T9SS type A sorting domain-containing protein [Bacteroidales bacterium]
FWPSASWDKSFLIMTPDSIYSRVIQGNDTSYVTSGTKNTYFAPHSGLQFFASVNAMDYDAGNQIASDDWMISPACSGNNPVRLSFYAKSFQCGGQYGLEDKFKVWGSTTGNTVADFKANGDPINAPYTKLDKDEDADWALFTYTFPAGTKYVAINCVSDKGYIFCVDDILIEEVHPYDLNALVMGYPDYSCQLTNAETIEMAIINNGINTVTEFDAYYQIGENGIPVKEHVTLAIAPGDTDVYTFATLADLTFAMDQDSIRGWVVLAEDDITANDTTPWGYTGVPASATVTYFNDFNNENEDYKGYSILDANADGYGWHYTIDEDDNDNGTWFCQTFGNNAANDWLFTSCFDLTAGSYIIDFYTKAYATYNTEKLGVYYGNDTDPDVMTNIANMTFSNDTYNQNSYMFNIPADGTYYIGFKGSSAAGQGDIYVDNLNLRLADTNDIAVNAIDVPAYSCELGANEVIKATVMNAGSADIAEFKAYYQIGNGTPVEETVTETILPGATYTYTFTTPADLTVAAPATVKVWAVLENDTYNANDTLSAESGLVASVNTFPYKNTFDTDEDILNWTLINGLNNPCYWGMNDYGYWYHLGYGAYSSQYPEYTGGEDWLISSCIDFEAKEYRLKFDYLVNDPDYSTSFDIYLGKKVSDNQSDYEMIEQISMVAPEDWETYEGTFSVPEAGTYYIAFYAYNDGRAMYLDNFEIEDNVSIADIENAKISLYPNPAQNEVSLRSDDMMSTVNVYDMFGKNVANYQVDAMEAQINVSNLATGMYIAKIATENGIVVKKFAVQK